MDYSFDDMMDAIYPALRLLETDPSRYTLYLQRIRLLERYPSALMFPELLTTDRVRDGFVYFVNIATERQSMNIVASSICAHSAKLMVRVNWNETNVLKQRQDVLDVDLDSIVFLARATSTTGAKYMKSFDTFYAFLDRDDCARFISENPAEMLPAARSS